MVLMIEAVEPAAAAVVEQTASPITVPLFEPLAGMDPARPLAVLVRSSAQPNWKPIVRQVLESWATNAVAPDCTETAVDADSIVARDAVEAFRITLAPEGGRVAQGGAIIRTVTPWCGADRKINVLVVFQNGRSRAMNLNVGDTLTGPQLYEDILRHANPILAQVMEASRVSCAGRFPGAAGRLTNTEATSLTGDPMNPTTWSERWTWTVCGRDTVADFIMTPQPDGSTKFDTKLVTP